MFGGSAPNWPLWWPKKRDVTKAGPKLTFYMFIFIFCWSQMKFLCSRCLHVEDSPAELTDRPIIIATLRCTLTFQLFENIKIMEIVKLINWHQYMYKYQVISLKFVQEIEYNIAPSPPSFLKIWNLKSSKWNSWPKVSVPLDLLKKKNTRFRPSYSCSGRSKVKYFRGRKIESGMFSTFSEW